MNEDQKKRIREEARRYVRRAGQMREDMLGDLIGRLNLFDKEDDVREIWDEAEGNEY